MFSVYSLTSCFEFNRKNYNFFDYDWFQKVLFSTNSPAKLLSDSLLLDSLLLDSLLSDSSISNIYICQVQYIWANILSLFKIHCCFISFPLFTVGISLPFFAQYLLNLTDPGLQRSGTLLHWLVVAVLPILEDFFIKDICCNPRLHDLV